MASDSSDALEPSPEVSDEAVQMLEAFSMPKAMKIPSAAGTINKNFAHEILPAVKPTADELTEALRILGMAEAIECAYCGDPATEWDHLRPLVVHQVPTGYISELHNLVPSCPKCNQSKTNKHWREWMFGPAKRSPLTRGVPDIHDRAVRLERYEAWLPPTQVDFPRIVGEDLWQTYQEKRMAIIAQLKEAGEITAEIRHRVAQAYGGPSSTSTQTHGPGGESWVVRTPSTSTGPVPKNRAVLETIKAALEVGVSVDAIAGVVGNGRLRAVPGQLDGETLWLLFATTYGKSDKHRKHWYLDHPVHAGGRTWVLARNVWGPHTGSILDALSELTGRTVVSHPWSQDSDT